MINLLFVKTASVLGIWMQLDSELQMAMREANAMPQNVVWQLPQLV